VRVCASLCPAKQYWVVYYYCITVYEIAQPIAFSHLPRFFETISGGIFPWKGSGQLKPSKHETLQSQMAEVQDNEAETIGFDEFVQEIEQSVLKMIAETSKAPETIKEQWQGDYCSALRQS